MKFALLLPVLGLAAYGIWSSNTSSPVSLTQPTSIDKEECAPAANSFWTTTPSIYSGEQIVLRFKGQNPDYMGVVDPSGHFFYVVFPEHEADEALQPLVSSEAFKSCQKLKINPSSFKADPYTYGVMENQQVFTQAGTYTFIMGENLHVDDPALVQKVEIKYTAKPRSESVIAEGNEVGEQPVSTRYASR